MVNRQQSQQEALKQVGERDPSRAGRHSEDDAHGQELSHPTQAGGAECRGCRHLGEAPLSPRQQQARHVAACVRGRVERSNRGDDVGDQ